MQQTENKVTGPYSAIVRGKPTGLAGCHDNACPRAEKCLRTDEALQARYSHDCKDAFLYYIPRVIDSAVRS